MHRDGKSPPTLTEPADHSKWVPLSPGAAVVTCHKLRPKCTLPQFWRPEVCDQAVGRATLPLGASEGLFLQLSEFLGVAGNPQHPMIHSCITPSSASSALGSPPWPCVYLFTSSSPQSPGLG